MLSTLRIEQLSIVENVEIEFRRGLNVITGETGAGKSIILKAIELLSGKRAASDIIRSGEERCVVEGLFSLPSWTIAQICAKTEGAVEIPGDGELLIRRIVDNSGRSKFYLNDRLATASLVQELSPLLIDITAQHQQQRLLDPACHREMLDKFDVPTELLREVEQKYSSWSKASEDLERFLTNSREQAGYFEQISAEHEELCAATLREGEREELEAELRRLGNAEGLSQTTQTCLELLEEDEYGIEERLRVLSSQLIAALRMDNKLHDAASLVDTALVQLQEGKLLLEEYQSSLEMDPNRLEQLRERIAEIARLERKYRMNVPELLGYSEKIGREIAEIQAGGFDEKKLRAMLEERRTELTRCEKQLSNARLKAAAKLSKEAEQQLKQLSMRRARFKVDLLPAPSSIHGADRVEFRLAANPGEPYQTLSKCASGGELSRILLVLKSVLREKQMPTLQIFDEIDSGVGGAIAEVVGEKLKQLASNAQVILVTHAPQIAALADAHFFIKKSTSGGRTRAEVEELSRNGRVEQIAAMLAGKQVTDKFKDSARELLKGRDPE